MQTKQDIDAILFDAGLERPEERRAREEKEKHAPMPTKGSPGQSDDTHRDAGEMMEW